MVFSPICRISFGSTPSFEQTSLDQNPSLDDRNCFLAGPENPLIPTIVEKIIEPFPLNCFVSPLVFWGGKGTGKSLLVRGLVKSCCDAGQDVCVFEAAKITYHSLKKIYSKSNRATLWVIDDFDQLSVNDSLINLFCDLLDRAPVDNHRIVITMRVPPNTTTYFTDRLRSRLNSGLVLKLNPLSGNNQITGDFGRRVNPLLVEICRVISKYFGISMRDLKGRSRQRGIVFPRQILMYLAHESYDHSLQKIGDFLGRDHSTVLHGCQMIKDKLGLDEEIQNHILLLQNSLEK